MADQLRFNTNYGCPICARLHAIRKCTRFLVLDVERKLRLVAEKSLCVSCLAQSHSVRDCRSLDRCKRCRQQHNTLLHPVASGSIWFPMTAMAKVYPHENSTHHKFVRILIDPNAARSSISEVKAKKLGLSTTSNRVMLKLGHRRFEHKKIRILCALERMPVIYAPLQEIKITGVSRREETVTADPMWYSRDSYDVVLGADVVPRVLEGPAEGQPGKIYTQKTFFGEAYFGEGKEETDPDYLDY